MADDRRELSGGRNFSSGDGGGALDGSLLDRSFPGGNDALGGPQATPRVSGGDAGAGILAVPAPIADAQAPAADTAGVSAGRSSCSTAASQERGSGVSASCEGPPHGSQGGGAHGLSCGDAAAGAVGDGDATVFGATGAASSRKSGGAVAAPHVALGPSGGLRAGSSGHGSSITQGWLSADGTTGAVCSIASVVGGGDAAAGGEPGARVAGGASDAGSENGPRPSGTASDASGFPETGGAAAVGGWSPGPGVQDHKSSTKGSALLVAPIGQPMASRGSGMGHTSSVYEFFSSLDIVANSDSESIVHKETIDLDASDADDLEAATAGKARHEGQRVEESRNSHSPTSKRHLSRDARFLEQLRELREVIRKVMCKCIELMERASTIEKRLGRLPARDKKWVADGLREQVAKALRCALHCKLALQAAFVVIAEGNVEDDLGQHAAEIKAMLDGIVKFSGALIDLAPEVAIEHKHVGFRVIGHTVAELARLETASSKAKRHS